MAAAQGQARDATYDVARGIGMALVIYGHLLEPIFPARPDLGKPFFEAAFAQWQVIYSFHMMLFFLVSGAVNKSLPKKSFQEVLRGSLRLLALAWLVHIVGAVVAIVAGYAPEARHSLYEAVNAIFYPIAAGFLWSIGVLWFLTSLCFVQLLAWFLLRRVPAIWVVLGAMALTAATIYAPNYYLFKTWMPGLSFFALGYLLAQRQVKFPFWLCIPLIAATILLAPLNTGCSFTLSESCWNVGPGLFGVWMFAGVYGFLPLFFLSSLVGSLGVISLSAGLARINASEALAYIGRHSLDLFILNGFVAVFAYHYIALIPWPPLSTWMYVALAIGVVAVHVGALIVLRPLLKALDTAALAIAGWLARLLSGPIPERSPYRA